ncbi:CDP-diacylglycerol--serine O-phosphatidyltransferase [Advenella kashmirensis WT001]|uniref:CDP-diacylglycerol--serine O-phosphatidyltransferase n=1 Tax=Advenella kashmirensis (strain DSM 17095 / LMG 22695 / WT001) TaxID=1036672 RepID=I3UEE2_ADVKW|nr:CDP-diacylglycerol--serine O-phosphatidyltransferase [Advenella kashmirensis]AFK63380.1 CDP-diacylglycerol--serine O-phosphatidyltransferase [Advenella kashmirensis WT001]
MNENLPRPRSAIYLLPNAFTTANLFAGFYAVVQAMSGRFEVAAIAIFVAMVLDAMDGRVARLTNTQSAFGEQYDSMSDMVSFGIAPALVMYEYQLQALGRWGWIAAFIYVAGAALRLARFNTNIGVVDSRFFQGLPSPAAAALVAGFVWLSVDNRIPDYESLAWLAFVLTVYAGISMISNAPFFSGKSLALEKKLSPQNIMLVLVLIFAFVSSDPPIVLFLLFIVYGLSGWIVWYWRWRRAQQLHDSRRESREAEAAEVAGAKAEGTSTPHKPIDAGQADRSQSPARNEPHIADSSEQSKPKDWFKKD